MRKKKELKDKRAYSKYQKKFSKISKDVFFTAGLMLYSGEGEKKNYTRLAIANTDYKILKFFISWMIEFLKIPKEKMKAGLHLYEDMNIEKEKNFWRKKLEFQDNQFYKPSVRKLRKSSFSYNESYRHGTCNIYASGVEKKREVMMAIQAFFDSYKKI